MFLAVCVAATCLGLGQWQWHRYRERSAEQSEVAQRYDAAAIPVAEAITGGGSLQWRRITATGEYALADTILVRNRPRDLSGKSPTFGFDIVVPLRLDGGGTLLVHRGWVPNSQSAARAGVRPDAVPSPPSGRVTIDANLRDSEPPRPQDLPPGQAASIDTRALGSELPQGAAVYAQLRAENPAAGTQPLLPARPVIDGREGINASYAVQWLLLAGISI
ncbi:MAG: SURF1 family protein, partial [Angustibacter sp.]